MSLYFDAISLLTTPSSTGGSFKSRIYNNARNLKSSPAQIYALIVETSKWDVLLKEVIENAGILKLEPKLYPLLALLLVYDHLLSKNGIAAPVSHPIRQAVERHKTRLRAEFTKARVRRGCASVEALKVAVRREKNAQLGPRTHVYPRWVRINNVRTTFEAQMKSTFAGYAEVSSLSELVQGDGEDEKRIFVDANIPDLVAVPPGVELSASPAYRNGEIILQDKASCFPAYLLLGDEEWTGGGLMDGCAAPGNKTTHMASLLSKQRKSKKNGDKQSIFSLDASKPRSKTLQKMVSAAGADQLVTVLPGQDFLALDPMDPRFEHVSGLLLDPSCSGSGIIGRDDVPKLTLPDPGPGKMNAWQGGKKRKRQHDEDNEPDATSTANTSATSTSTSVTDENEFSGTITHDRLVKLSSLQSRIVEHALSFPAATHVTYSTCSIHLLENEVVVSTILASEVAKSRGWRVLRKDEQPAGLREWKHRGIRSEGSDTAVEGEEVSVDLSDEELQGCIRCWHGDEEGLGGFFVVGFVRDEMAIRLDKGASKDEGEDDEWDGFSD